MSMLLMTMSIAVAGIDSTTSTSSSNVVQAIEIAVDYENTHDALDSNLDSNSEASIIAQFLSVDQSSDAQYLASFSLSISLSNLMNTSDNWVEVTPPWFPNAVFHSFSYPADIRPPII